MVVNRCSGRHAYECTHRGLQAPENAGHKDTRVTKITAVTTVKDGVEGITNIILALRVPGVRCALVVSLGVWCERRGRTRTAKSPPRCWPCVRSEPAEQIVASIASQLETRGQRLAVAESVTGGELAGRLTAHPGASAWFAGGIVAYQADVKARLLDVDETVLERHGAVSAETTRAMADGVLARTGVDWVIAVTGYAGPEGGPAGESVGTVHIVVRSADGTEVHEPHAFEGDRGQVRSQAVEQAMATMLRELERHE